MLQAKQTERAAIHLNEFARLAARDVGLITEDEFNDSQPSASAVAQGTLPTMVERNGHPYEQNTVQGVGFNVLFADGHVQFFTQEALDGEVGPYYALR